MTADDGEQAVGTSGSGQQDNDYAWLEAQLQQMAEGGEITLEQLQALGAAMAGGWEDPFDGQLTALLDAATEGDLEQAAAIIRETDGLDVNHPGPDGDTALHLASLYGHTEVAKLLLDHGANAGVVNQEDGSTALHDAAASGHLDILSALLAAAPEAIKAADEDGDTPLHNAARGNHAALVTALLEAGADPTAVNGEGHTPAQEAEDAEVVSRLEAAASARNEH